MPKRSPLRVIDVGGTTAHTTFALVFEPQRVCDRRGHGFSTTSLECYRAAKDVRDRLRERLREAPFLVEPRRIVRRLHHSTSRVYIFRVPTEHMVAIATIVGEEFGRAKRRYRRRHPVVL